MLRVKTLELTVNVKAKCSRVTGSWPGESNMRLLSKTKVAPSSRPFQASMTAKSAGVSERPNLTPTQLLLQLQISNSIIIRTDKEDCRSA